MKHNEPEYLEQWGSKIRTSGGNGQSLYETAPRMPVRVVRSTPFYEQPWDETDEYLLDDEEEEWF